jgi:hypothetical protein
VAAGACVAAGASAAGGAPHAAKIRAMIGNSANERSIFFMGYSPLLNEHLNSVVRVPAA